MAAPTSELLNNAKLFRARRKIFYAISYKAKKLLSGSYFHIIKIKWKYVQRALDGFILPSGSEVGARMARFILSELISILDNPPVQSVSV